MHRISATAIAGALAALGLTVLRLGKGRNAQEISVAIWFRAGAMPLARSLVRSMLSVTIVGLGAAVGRECALKQAGAALAYRFAGSTHRHGG